jgi:hypothetical protein
VARKGDRLVAGGCLANDRDVVIGLEQQTEADAHQPLAVGDEHPDGRWGSGDAETRFMDALDDGEPATTCVLARMFAHRGGTETAVSGLIAAAFCLN